MINDFQNQGRIEWEVVSLGRYFFVERVKYSKHNCFDVFTTQGKLQKNMGLHTFKGLYACMVQKWCPHDSWNHYGSWFIALIKNQFEWALLTVNTLIRSWLLCSNWIDRKVTCGFLVKLIKGMDRQLHRKKLFS